MPAKKKEAGLIKVQQIGSPIRRNKVQKEYLVSLGLGKMHKVRELKDNSTVRGLLAKVPHLVKVVEG